MRLSFLFVLAVLAFAGARAAEVPEISLCGWAISGAETHNGRDRNWDAAMETPASVLLMRRDRDGRPQQCGGVLVGDRWVLTARHCVEGQVWRELRVSYGSRRGLQGDPGGRRSVVAAYCPAVETDGLRGDLALLRLNRPVSRAIARPDLDGVEGLISLGLPEVLKFARWRNTLGAGGNGGLKVSPLSVVGRGSDGLVQAEMVYRHEEPPCGGESGSGIYRMAGDAQVLVGILSAIQTPVGKKVCTSSRTRALITPVAPWRTWIETVMSRCASGDCGLSH